MLTEERLRELLSRAEGATEVIIGRDEGKFVAIIVSPAYEGKDEDERQCEAWGLVLDNLTDDEAAQVSFMYTNTAEEKAQAGRDAAAQRAAEAAAAAAAEAAG